jgi:hypothetical protein
MDAAYLVVTQSERLDPVVNTYRGNILRDEFVLTIPVQ